jgi:hypothetical protein
MQWRRSEIQRGVLPMQPVFASLCKYWRLSQAQERQFWAALAVACAPEPSAWRQHLALYQQTGLGSPAHIVDGVSTPATVIGVLEALIEERRLPARLAREMEECILQRTGRDGRWLRPPSHER